ncbi:hypothetical protein R6231_14490 [Bacillus cytotoxicus]|uniref:hypothetical protein n=1 Tax=Bacillus cereus group TaxID=86661 RepID=UPI000B972086|nr:MULTISPECIES: hypothetical protein [Bacillus cereus group]AWC31010.1 hypothetical protein CG483_022590 [Bacillus cytotoxicus]AWC35042.1 hypothetical protein CG482_022555 [Bacillus cytotoxicus]AWC39081.1 hypothetical protein CG481_022560 [Bacillus cytotoxicus]AWC43102.1 hypothetical protein CG480_022425 [Bacillus cytotoxicus]AWC46985.1 hypothetical protein CG479_021525 [Bacillus cytotoxicus]
MDTILNKEVSTSFFDQFFSENKVENDVFVISVNKKYFFIESNTVIDMIKKFSPKDQQYIKRHLLLCNLLNRDLSTCLKEIATDYVRTFFGDTDDKKIECKLLPLHSIYNMN